MKLTRLLAILAVASAPLCTFAQTDSTTPIPPTTAAVVAEVRVHGNDTMTDADVIAAAGVAVGDHIDAAALTTIESRLRQSGRFASVQLSVRHRSLSGDGPAVLIIVVTERPPIHDRMQWLPLVDYTEDHGFTAGARVAADGILGHNEHLQVDATLGGIRELRGTGWRAFENRWLDRLELSLGRSESNHPNLDRDLERTAVDGRVARAIGPLQLGLSLDWSKTDLAAEEHRLVGVGADLTFDTRDATNFPRDAVFGRVAVQRFDVTGPGTSAFNRLQVEGRGYKSLVGQTVLASMVELDLVSTAIPNAVRPYLGGAESLRGYAAGSFIADNRLFSSIELRVPLGSPFALSHAGVHAFLDSGTVWNDGRSLGSRALHNGVGIGAYLRVAFVRARIDLAHDFAGNFRLHFSTSNRF